MRLIDADALILKLEKEKTECIDKYIGTTRWQMLDYYNFTIDIIEKEIEMPAAKWNEDICSSCGLPWNFHMTMNADDYGYFDPMPAYCPNCGARMNRGE